MIKWPIEVVRNKYSIWYEQLILSAVNRILPAETYTEKHHIIPFCISKSNDISNLVVLTAREHYIAHALLWKMNMSPKWHNKMTMALHVMVNGSGTDKQKRTYRINSKVFESNRLEWAADLSERMKGKGNHFYGKKHSPEAIEKIKEANQRTKDIRSAKVTGSLNAMYGKTHSLEMKKQISDSVSAAWTDDKKKAKSEWSKQRWKDPVYRKQMADIRKTSEGWLNRDWSTANKKAAETRKRNGTDKRTPAQRKHLSDVRKAKIASGEIIPWNKGTAKPKIIRSPAEKLAIKEAGIAKMRISKLAKKDDGWINPNIGKKSSAESRAKAKLTRANNKAAGKKINRTPWSESTKQAAAEKFNATITARKLNGWVSPMRGILKSEDHKQKLSESKQGDKNPMSANRIQSRRT